MAPYSLTRPLTFISFEDKAQFSANQELSLARSKYFKLPEIERRSDVWSIKPPDFSVKLYRSLTLRHEKERKDSSPAFSQQSVMKWKSGVILPTVLHESYRKKEPMKFITSYRPPDALESELMFVRTGKFPSGPYRNPKPHDFRPLDEDLPDLVTTYERDPGNLKLKLKSLDIIQTTIPESNCTSRGYKTKMDIFKPPEPKWDGRLILPEVPWPPKSASYTVSGELRHKRSRGAYSAFLDRVEEKLSRTWSTRK